MMRKLFVLSIAMCIAILVSSIVPAQEAPLNFMNDLTCRYPCVLGIQAGLASEEELVDVLQNNQIQYFIENIGSEKHYYLDLDEEYDVSTTPIIIAVDGNGVVRKISIPLDIAVEKIVEVYGEPSSQFQRRDGTVRLHYAHEGLSFSLDETGKRSIEADIVQPLRDRMDLNVVAYGGMDRTIDDSNGYPALGILDGSRSTGKDVAYIWWQDGEVVGREERALLPLEYGEYTFNLTVIDENGNADVDTVSINVLETEPSPTNGLYGEYFDEFGLRDLKFVRIDPVINFDFGRNSPREDMNILNFSILWRGQIEAPETGTYTFSTDVIDDVLLWIDDKKVLYNWFYGDEQPGTIELKGGERYDIRIEFQKSGGLGEIVLYWQTPDNPLKREVVPSDVLYYDVISDTVPPIANAGPDRVFAIGDEKNTSIVLDGRGSIGRDAEIVSYAWIFKDEVISVLPNPEVKAEQGANEYTLLVTDANGITGKDTVIITVNDLDPNTGLVGEYFTERDLGGQSFLRIDPNIDFRWGSVAPMIGMDTIRYSIRWSGYLEVPKNGEYNLITNSDDGVRLFLDGEPIIDNWTFHAAELDSASVTLQTGRRYPIILEYFQGQGNAVIELAWIKPDENEPEIIPQQFFYQTADSPSNLDSGE